MLSWNYELACKNLVLGGLKQKDTWHSDLGVILGVGQVLITVSRFLQTIASSSSTLLFFLPVEAAVVVDVVAVVVEVVAVDVEVAVEVEVVAVEVDVAVEVEVVADVVVVGGAAGGKRIAMGLRQPWETATTREKQRRNLNMLLIWAQDWDWQSSQQESRL